jgi:hypothetical protein
MQWQGSRAGGAVVQLPRRMLSPKRAALAQTAAAEKREEPATTCYAVSNAQICSVRKLYELDGRSAELCVARRFFGRLRSACRRAC